MRKMIVVRAEATWMRKMIVVRAEIAMTDLIHAKMVRLEWVRAVGAQEWAGRLELAVRLEWAAAIRMEHSLV